MRKTLLQIVALILIPCLVGDSATASAYNPAVLHNTLQPCVAVANPKTHFEQEAVIPPVASSQYPGKNGNLSETVRGQVIHIVAPGGAFGQKPALPGSPLLKFLTPIALAASLLLIACGGGSHSGGSNLNDSSDNPQDWINVQNAIHNTAPVMVYTRPGTSIDISTYSDYPSNDLSTSDLQFEKSLFDNLLGYQLQNIHEVADVPLYSTVQGFTDLPVGAETFTDYGIIAINGNGNNADLTHEIGHMVRVGLPQDAIRQWQSLYDQSKDPFWDFCNGDRCYYWVAGQPTPGPVFGSINWYEDFASVFSGWVSASGWEGSNGQTDQYGLPVFPISELMEAIYRAAHGHPLILEKHLFLASLFANSQNRTIEFVRINGLYDDGGNYPPVSRDDRPYVLTDNTLQLGYVTFVLQNKQISEAKATAQSFSIDGVMRDQAAFDVIFAQPIPIPQIVFDRLSGNVSSSASSPIPSPAQFDADPLHHTTTPAFKSMKRTNDSRTILSNQHNHEKGFFVVGFIIPMAMGLILSAIAAPWIGHHAHQIALLFANHFVQSLITSLGLLAMTVNIQPSRRSFLKSLIGLAATLMNVGQAFGSIGIRRGSLTPEEMQRFGRVWNLLLTHMDTQDRELLLQPVQQAELQKIDPMFYYNQLNGKFRLPSYAYNPHSATIRATFPDGHSLRIIAIHPEAFTDDAHLTADLAHELSMLLDQLEGKISPNDPQNKAEALGARKALQIMDRMLNDPRIQKSRPEFVEALKKQRQETYRIAQSWENSALVPQPYLIQSESAPTSPQETQGYGFLRYFIPGAVVAAIVGWIIHRRMNDGGEGPGAPPSATGKRPKKLPPTGRSRRPAKPLKMGMVVFQRTMSLTTLYRAVSGLAVLVATYLLVPSVKRSLSRIPQHLTLFLRAA